MDCGEDRDKNNSYKKNTKILFSGKSLEKNEPYQKLQYYY